MYLEPKERNKYTIGKYLRKLKRLGKQDTSAQIVEMPTELQEYYNELIQKGLQVKNLKFAIFETRNGLKYPGLVATEKIPANTIIVKVPVECLLTTRDAFFSDIEKIFVENPAFFAQKFSIEWEDRILLTFLLYEYQKGIDSKWWNLIRNLPREIDYAIFWTEEEISNFEDENLSKHIKLEKTKFEEESNSLIKILNKYPEFFTPQTLTKENIIWLHTHIVTRCFGKYFEYTTMVPFAELFNHECIDVYYTMYYKPGNPHDEKEEFYSEKELTDQELDEEDSSDGSYEAEDFEEEDEFIKGNIDKDEWEITATKYGEETAKDIKNCLHHMFTFINFSDTLSLHFIKIVLRELDNIANLKSLEAKKKKCEEIHNLNVLYIRKIKEFYKKQKRKFYSSTITQKQKPTPIKPPETPEEGKNYFESPWPKDKFDEFYMLCSSKDQFEKGAQVFFCYGRLPNKLLLMRYGIALEHNKYDHVFVRINVNDEILGNRHMRTVLKDIQIKKYKKFKVKRTKISNELISYVRMLKWEYGDKIENIFTVSDCNRELEVLKSAKELILQELGKFKAQVNINEQKLTQKDLGYHRYFALVYKVEQQRILIEQIKMIDYALHILSLMNNGMSLKQALEDEKEKQCLMYQIMMENYFKMFELETPKVL